VSNERPHLREVLEAFILPHIKNWKIIKEDGEEDFEPMTLLLSLIESEVPLLEAGDLFDGIVERVEQMFPDGKFHHADLHQLVVEGISSSGHRNSARWLSNYSNIYGPDLSTVSSDTNLVYVRKAGELKSFILSFIGEYLGLDTKNASTLRETLYSLCGKDEIDTTVNTMLTLVRRTGFYLVRKEFLKSFCEELAHYSYKIPLSVPNRELSQARKQLSDQESILAMAHKESIVNPTMAETYLNIVCEGIAAVLLEYFGLPASRVSQESMKQLYARLNDYKQLCFAGADQDSPNLCCRFGAKLEQALQSHFTIDELINLCKRILDRQGKQDSRNVLNQIGDIQRLLTRVIIAVEGDPKRAQLAADAESIGKAPLTFLETLAEYLRSVGIPSRLSSMSSTQNLLLVEVPGWATDLLSLGETLAITPITVSTGKALSLGDFSNLINYLQQNRKTVGIPITEAEVAHEIMEKFREFGTTTRMFILPRTAQQLLKNLADPNEFFDNLIRAFDRIYPKLRRRSLSIPAQVQAPLPDSIQGYERACLLEAWQGLMMNCRDECAVKISRLHEELLRQTVDQILALGKHTGTDTWIKASSEKGAITRSCAPYDISLAECIAYLRKVRSFVSSIVFADVFPFLPSLVDIRNVADIRIIRNEEIHEGLSHREVHSYYINGVQITEAFALNNRGVGIAAFVERSDGRRFILYESGEKVVPYLPQEFDSRSVSFSPGLLLWKFTSKEKHGTLLVPIELPCKNKDCLKVSKAFFSFGSTLQQCQYCYHGIPLRGRLKVFVKLARSVNASLNEQIKSALPDDLTGMIEHLNSLSEKDPEKTEAFRHIEHERLIILVIKSLGEYLGRYSAEYKVHGGGEMGVDVLVSGSDNTKIGIQVKSFGDIQSSGYIRYMNHQIQQSRGQGLDAFFLFFCTSEIVHEKRIATFANQLQKQKDSYIPISRIITPRACYSLLARWLD